jgi:phospholipid/cholesterol/gamma-HCH transport system substrate-binding protein
METRANFVLIGAFTLAVIAGAFMFVLWFSGLTRTADHQTYAILFDGSVAGLSRGSGVQFNGIRVGEVTAINLVANDPRRVEVLVNLVGHVPINQDTKARLEVQGLTGGAAIALTGGAPDSPPLVSNDGGPPVIVGESSEMQNILQAVQSLSAKADTVLGRIDKLVGDNSAAINDAVRNIDTFSKALSDNSAGVNSALTGVADLGKKIGPLSDRLQGLSDDLDKLVKAVDPAKVSGIVGDVKSLTGSLADNKAAINSTIADAAALAKQLNGSAAKLDSTLADFDNLVKAVDAKKIANFVDGADALGQTLQQRQGDIDAMVKNATELSAKLNHSADKIDGLMTSLQGFVGSPDLKGPLGEIGDAARSVRQLADNLDVRTKDIAAGLNHFTTTGLREYEALAIDGRRTINDLDRAIRSFERNPNELLFGAKSSLPEYQGGK